MCAAVVTAGSMRLFLDSLCFLALDMDPVEVGSARGGQAELRRIGPTPIDSTFQGI